MGFLTAGAIIENERLCQDDEFEVACFGKTEARVVERKWAAFARPRVTEPFVPSDQFGALPDDGHLDANASRRARDCLRRMNQRAA